MELARFILKWCILHDFPILKKMYGSPEVFTEGKAIARNFNIGLQQLQKCLVVDIESLFFVTILLVDDNKYEYLCRQNVYQKGHQSD